jgi:hypothetical protein
MSAMFAGIAFTVVFSIPALVREIRLARRFDRPPAVRGRVHDRWKGSTGLLVCLAAVTKKIRTGG